MGLCNTLLKHYRWPRPKTRHDFLQKKSSILQQIIKFYYSIDRELLSEKRIGSCKNIFYVQTALWPSVLLLGEWEMLVFSKKSYAGHPVFWRNFGLTFYTFILVIAIAKCQRAKIFAYTRALFKLFRNVMNHRNLRKIVCTQFDWISENYLDNSALTLKRK